MATNRRVSRVASLIKREVSSMLIGDIKDDRVGAGMVSVTDVDVSGDLQHAKIFVSIYGTEEAKLETMAGLTAATGYIRRELGSRIRLRRTPEVLFCEDRSLERGDQTLHLLDRIRQERQSHPLDVDTTHQTATEADLSTDLSEDLEDAEFEDLDADLDD